MQSHTIYQCQLSQEKLDQVISKYGDSAFHHPHSGGVIIDLSDFHHEEEGDHAHDFSEWMGISWLDYAHMEGAYVHFYN